VADLPVVQPVLSDEDLEAGRLLFARPWTFVKTCVNVADLPTPDGVEVAFAGRSNVGKSSLINALCGRGELARTSNTPGRTQALNIFENEAGGFRLVDMPGYGFARAPKTAVAQWTALIHAYLRGRPSLRRVYALVDARHGVKANDTTLFNELDSAAVSYQVVLTKADKLKEAALAAVIENAAARLSKHTAAHPELIVTSAQSSAGLDILRAEIAQLG
jgi:GTP-binding protein